jgi:cob(I)alamin adenosyltransferase
VRGEELESSAPIRHNRAMKIYTKTGDDGTTGLFGGGRVAKASPRVEAYGTVDELNAVLGVARAQPGAGAAALEDLLAQIQFDLFTMGAELACVPGKEAKLGMRLLDDADAERLEQAIDRHETGLPPLTHFVLPGGGPRAAALHVCRTVCRRAERALLAIDDGTPRRELVVYLNRLSDLLFVLARAANHAASVADVLWVPRARKGDKGDAGSDQGGTAT